MSSNSLFFDISGGISSSPAAFLFLFHINESSSSCVNCPKSMSYRLLIIFPIASCVSFRGFPCKFSKCFFHSCIRSSWLVDSSLALAVLFLLFTSFSVCHAILECLSSSDFLILSIWFRMYSACSFRLGWFGLMAYQPCSLRYILANSFCAFLSFKALILVGFLLLHLEAVFMSVCFFFDPLISPMGLLV